MCVRIFGFRDPAALQLADQLGLAMQLTNILRDVREDFELGRVYLPQDELNRFAEAEESFAQAIAAAPPPEKTTFSSGSFLMDSPS